MQGLGSSLAQAQQGPFFNWFCLEPDGEVEITETGRRSNSIRSWHRFRPSGPSFRSLVVLELGLDADKAIVMACLGIDRAFIAKARIRPFARDIAASFLRWALPEQALSALSADIEQISQFGDGESPVIARRDRITSWLNSLRTLRAEPVAAAVFIGCRQRACPRIGGTRVLFENRVGVLPPVLRAVARSVPCGLPTAQQDGWLRIVAGPDDSRSTFS